jgi:hypothetical protein
MSLVDRVKNILTAPQKEFEVINGESGNASTITTTYVVPLVLIGAVASFIGYGFIGISYGFLGSYHSVGFGLKMAIWYAVAGILSTFILAFIIDALAPNYGAEKNFDPSFKVAAYSSTASWVAGVFNLIPSLALIAGLGGLYSLYLLYVGLGSLKKSPEDKKTMYFVIVLVVAIVVYIVLGLIASKILYPDLGMGGFRIN